jgi:hypothetical protein
MAGFGNPEGATEGSKGFIAFDQQWGDIAFDPSDRRTRIIVGRRGSGKSRFMRALEREASRDDDRRLLVFPQRDQIISVAYLRWLQATYTEQAERHEVWRRLWACSIYTSIASNAINSSAPLGTIINVSSEDREFFANFCGEHRLRAPGITPIVAVLNLFIRKYQDRSRLEAFLADAKWIELENRVLRVISNSTPIACYIDTLDENYGAAPAAATDCQVGLMHWILSQLNDPNVGHRLHVVVAVRETVYAALMQGEQAQRYNRHTAIRCLDWERGAAEMFLYEKVRSLPDSSRVSLKDKTEMSRWLGIEVLENPLRGNRKEHIADLILRHTRFLPREIVEIGNRLADYVDGRLARKEQVTEAGIFQAIIDESDLIGTRAIETAVDHMLALDDDRTKKIPKNGFRDRIISAIHTSFIPALKEERIPRRKLQEADLGFRNAMDNWSLVSQCRELQLSGIFWLHGLLGFEAQNGPTPTVKFFGSTRTLESSISRELPAADHYYLHSALIKSERFEMLQTAPIPETDSPR